MMAPKRTKTDRLLGQMRSRRRPELKTPIATDMMLPNNSGVSNHPEFKNNTFWQKNGSILSPKDDVTKLLIEQDTEFDLASTECVVIKKPADATGTCFPLEIRGGWKLPTSSAQILFSTNDTDNSTQIGGFGLRHYDKDEPPIALLNAATFVAGNQLFWGGGTALVNGATQHFFIVRDGTTSTSDLQAIQMDVDSDGNPTTLIPRFGTYFAKFGWGTAGANPAVSSYASAGSTVWLDTNDKTASTLKIGDGNGDGTGADYTEIESDGDIIFNGGAGVPFGSCYGNEIAWTQVAAINTWYNISDGDMADGNLHNVTHDGNGKLTVSKAGMYLINYAITLGSSIANKHIQTGIEISGSGSADNQGIQHVDVAGVNNELVSAGNGIFDLAAAATIEVAIRTTDAGNPTITVDHINLSIVQIGGT